MKREIILHMLQWNLNDIIKELPTIKDCGYTSIQISPVQRCKDGDEWWCLYQPLGFKIGNRYGSKEDLINLCREAKKYDIKIIVDIVLRHTANEGGGDLQLVPHHDVDKEILDMREWFFTNAKNSDNNYTTRDQACYRACGLPMLSYFNWDLQNIMIRFLDELVECGVQGFRLDQYKHYALPHEGCDFIDRVFMKYKTRGLFLYGEVLEYSKEMLDQFTQYMNVITDGSPSDKSKAVIFVNSHDTDLSFHITERMSEDLLLDEWEYLLKTNKESHVIWFCRRFKDTWKSERIKNINKTYR